MTASPRKTVSGFFARALALCLFALCSNLAFAQAVAPSEAQKIQMLIHNVEVSKEIRFVRNGSDHDGAAAADHLRTKLKFAGSKIKTADQFITYLATGSSFSGKPYHIRFADGREVESATYFRAMLAKIEHPAVAPSKPLPATPATPVPPIAVAPVPLPVTTHALTESQKIHSLIDGMETTKGARFIRDGRSYSVTQAAGYLRQQLRLAGKRVVTAQDFIVECASRAPKTGRANRIRFANGREMDAGLYFRTRLAMIERSASAIRPIAANPTPSH